MSCGKPLKGRLDKKFCDDYCRNAFNNQSNSDQNNFMRNVNNILRKNRRVLEELLPAELETRRISKTKLLELGFNFTYHTQQYTNVKGQVYYYSYEYGYLSLGEDLYLICKMKS